VPSNGCILDLMDKIKDRAQLALAAHLLVVWRLCNPRGSREIMRSLPNLTRLGEALVEGEGQDEAAWLVPAEEEILLHFSGLQRSRISARVWVPPPSQIGGSSDDVGGKCPIHLLTPAYRVWRTRCPTMQMAVVSARSLSKRMKLCSSK